MRPASLLLGAALCIVAHESGAQTFDWPCQPKCVDTGVRWRGNTHFLFRGGQYIQFTGDEPDDGYPRPLAGNWNGLQGAWAAGIDAAVNWGNGRIYLFKGSQYLRYNVTADQDTYARPLPIAGNWRGFPRSWFSGINAGINWGDGKIFFFRGHEYLRFDIASESVDADFPRPIGGNWSGFPGSWAAGIDAAMNWGDNHVYFFKGARYLRYDIGSRGQFNYTRPQPVFENWEVFAEPANPKLNETIARIPVSITGLDKATRNDALILTHYRPNGPGPFPAVIYSHGRRPENRAWPARYREAAIADYWLRRGFAFFIATRLGYGATGLEPDVESAGGICVYEPGTRAVVTQAIAVANYARTLPFVDRNRLLLVGNSTGGLAMVVASGTQLPGGVVAALNFAGGHGGNATPGGPCNPEGIERLAAHAGRAARIPMLWVYSENDGLWGPKHPRQWHAAYAKAGGKAEFHQFRGDKGGHDIIRHPAIWDPVVNAYLKRLGFPVRR